MNYYNESEARELVIEAGHKLLENKLIARTWGNISARISEDEFIITPSGRAYDTLRPEELVKVNMTNLSYQGALKPSSEKGIHAHAYLLKENVSFIIHTHQLYASAVCAEGKDLPFAPCASYGLPGTGKLKMNVSKSIIMNDESYSFLMEKHGALLLGKSFDDAFALAEDLEDKCKAEFISRVGNIAEDRFVYEYEKAHSSLAAYVDDYAQLIGPTAKIKLGQVVTPASDDEEAVKMIVTKNCAAALYVRSAKPLSLADALLQRAVYLKKYSKQKDK